MLKVLVELTVSSKTGARFANRFWVQVWSHFGPILEPNLVQKSSQKSRAILRQFLIPFWDHVWSHFGTFLDTFWRHFGELCVASTASADIAKTIKNQWFFNDFAKIGSLNGVGKGLKLALVFGLLFGTNLEPQNGPNMAPESQNGPKMAPNWRFDGLSGVAAARHRLSMFFGLRRHL